MRDTLFFERKVDSRFEGEDVRIERLGTNKYRLWTGSDDDFDFDNRMKWERFDEKFIEAFNQAVDEKHQLEVTDREVQMALRDLRKALERGKNTIKFKVTFRMTT